MVKKKRRHPDVEQVLARPWCFYCERDFDDLKILISHQKAKHFKCERCGRRLNTAGGLSVHMNQVHKETLNSVDNALPNRAGLDVEIFGMEGIPEDVIASHNNRVIQQFYEAEADRRKTSGNPAPGSKSDNSGQKKPKVEQPNDLKKRLAEHKAKKAALQAGGNSGNATPLGAGQAASPPTGHNASSLPVAGSPFSSNAISHNGTHGSPPAVQPFQTPGPPHFAHQPQAFQQGMQVPGSSQLITPAIPGMPQQGGNLFSPPGGGNFNLPPGANYPLGQQFPREPPSVTPPNLPGVTGLPQRPVFPGSQPQASFPTPHVQAPFQSSIGSLQAPGESPMGQNGQTVRYPGSMTSTQNTGVAPGTVTSAANGKSVDSDKNAEAIATAKKLAADASVDKKSNSKKDRSIKLVYSDNDISPEEKMAALPRYTFKREKKEETVLGTVTASVTGIAVGPDDVIDKQG